MSSRLQIDKKYIDWQSNKYITEKIFEGENE